MKKEFDDLYNELIQNENMKIVNPNLRLFICVIFLILITIISEKYFNQYFSVIGIILFVLYIVFILGIVFFQDKYMKDYKNKILSNIVKLYDSNLTYESKFDIGVQNYKKSRLPQKIDKFTSRDGISGTIKGNSYLRMAYIKTKKKQVRNVEGRNEIDWITTFYGMFGYAVVNKSVNAIVDIKTNDLTKKYNKNRIELESSEFEKKFDCFSENKIIALQILTPNVIEKINVLQNTLNVPLEITIINDTIYYRLLINDYFYPPKFGNPVDKGRIKKIYDIIDVAYELVDCISEGMMEI